LPKLYEYTALLWRFFWSNPT